MNRNPLPAFLLAAALLTGTGTRAQEKPAPKTWHENAGDIAPVGEDGIAAYAQFCADTILATYHANAAKGKHTVVLMGEIHTMMPHLLLQALVNKKIVATLPPERFLYTMEEPTEESGRLRTLGRIAAHNTHLPLDDQARLYDSAFESSGNEFRIMNMLQVASRHEIRYVDIDRTDGYEAHIDSLALCA